MAEEMADGLATINVEQLSRDVNAIVQAAACINPSFGNDSEDSDACQTSSRQANLSQLYFSSPSFASPPSHVNGQNFHDRTQNLERTENKLTPQSNKETLFVVPRQYSSQHLQPILPATMAPSDQQTGSRGVATESNTVHIVSASSDLEPYSNSSISHTGDMVSSDVDVSSYSSSIALNISGSSQSLQASTNDQRQPINHHGQLDIQVPSLTQSQLLNSLHGQSAQSLLSQMALFSPGNQDASGIAQFQSAQLQSLLSPHSQATLLPYLLRSLQSPGPSTANIIDLNLLTDVANNCNQNQNMPHLNLPQASQDIVYPDQEQEANLPARSNNVSRQSYKRVEQVVTLDLPVQGNPGIETDQEISTIAPSIITSSIHSLCLPTPGVNTNALSSTGVVPGVNSQVNVLPPNFVQNGIQLSRMVTTKDRGGGAQSNDVNLQSVMHLSEMRTPPPDTAQEQDYWCVHCDESMPQVCPQHGPPTVILDTPIQRRARMTLPPSLYLKKSNISKDFLGVWAKEAMKIGCMFGPLEGIYLKKIPSNVDTLSPLLWKVFQNDQIKHYIDVKNEDISNWMMFVKRARKLEEQNLAAHQMKGQIYFTSKRNINAGEELLLWYNRDYAKMCGATVIPEDSFKCNLCGRQFSYRQELSGHMQYRHPSTSERKFSCKVCDKAFTTSTKLKVHALKHTGDKPYPCKICHKSFTDRSNLNRHTKIHSGEKQFHCTICGMSFRQKAHLVTHTVTHTGEKKLKCQYCGKLFARKSDIRLHTMSHIQDKKYKCTICSQSFVRNHHLKNHLLTHTKERNYACNVCKKTFSTNTHLQRHRKICSKKYTPIMKVSLV